MSAYGNAAYGSSAYADSSATANVIQLEGTVVPTPSASADLTKIQAMTGTVTSTLTVTADLDPVLLLSGNMSIDSSASADLTKNILLQGSATSFLTASASLRREKLLTGIVSPTSSMSADLSRVKKLKGTATPHLQLDSPVLQKQKLLKGNVSPTSAVNNPALLALLNSPEIIRPVKAVITNLNRKLSILNIDRYIVMEDHTFKKGDYADPVTLQLKDEEGVVDLTGSQPKLHLQNTDGETVLEENMTIENASEGRVKYEWMEDGSDPIDKAGIYRMEVEVMYADGKQTFPNDGYNNISVEEDIE